MTDDAESFESVLDETGGAEEDDLEADDDGTYELDAIRKFAANVKEEDDVTTIDGAAAIKRSNRAYLQSDKRRYRISFNLPGESKEIFRLSCEICAGKYSNVPYGYYPCESSG